MSQNPITGVEETLTYETTVGPVYQNGQKMSFEYTYDFAKQGGAIGTIFLPGRPMPKGFIVTGASFIDVIAAVTSGGAATVSLGVESAVDIRTAQTLATAPALSAIAVVDLATNPAFAEETTFIKTTVVRRPLMTIAAFALTAGKFVLVIEGNISR
jgi:hypothetical protein